ncbi:MAG: ABC transporter substrate-binding protein [Synergistaceae bacterium]|jgi:ribose transport system substrate-binding protein|nr:ABC transporter substrate-binding protein [Synergistaceae bacterium]
MRKSGFVVVLLSFVILLSLLGGVALAAEGEVDSAKYKKDPPYVVGLSNVSPANAFKVAMVEEFKVVCEERKDLIKEYYITDAGGQIAKQIADIEDLIAKNVDILLVTAASPTAISPVVEKAVDRGIVVVTFDNLVDTDKVTLRVEANEAGIGIQNMEWLCKKLDGKGKIVMLGGIKGTSSAQLRWDGALDVLKKYPGVEVIGEAWVNWAFDRGKAAMESLLAANPAIDGVWTDGGGSAQGALTAMLEAGRVVPIVGTASNGFAKLWVELKAKSDFEAFCATNPPYCSVLALDYALDVLAGKPVQRHIKTELVIMDNSNVDKLVRPDFSDMFWVDTLLSDEQNKELWGSK